MKIIPEQPPRRVTHSLSLLCSPRKAGGIPKNLGGVRKHPGGDGHPQLPGPSTAPPTRDHPRRLHRHQEWTLLISPGLTRANFVLRLVETGLERVNLQQGGKALLASLFFPGRAPLGGILKAFVSRSCQSPHLSQALKRPREKKKPKKTLKKRSASGIIILAS